MIDTQRQVDTPEGLALNLRCAGMAPRALAWAVDFGLRLSAVLVVLMVLGLLGDTGRGIALLAIFIVYWGYPVLFEVLRDGQTIGKRVLGLRVVNDNGTPVTWLPSIVRNLLRTVDMMPFGYGFGLLSGMLDPASRRLGDHAAGTLVIYAERNAARASAPVAPAEAPPEALRQEEQRAIVDFAERASQMTPDRQAELAGLLAPVTGRHGAEAARYLVAAANHLLGRR